LTKALSFDARCNNGVVYYFSADSIDWIITDPPYPKELLGVYDDLGSLAANVLKPGGSLVCMIGQYHLPAIIEKLSAHLTYHWTIPYLTPGQTTRVFPRRINPFWKPVLWFTKGEFNGDWVGDVAKSSAGDKRFHEWGQSESGFRDLMARFVKPGDSILDPFMGAGTTGVVALELGAKFIGIEPKTNAFNAAAVRIDRASGCLRIELPWPRTRRNAWVSGWNKGSVDREGAK
jgi:16S rRNA G966 N2-methylase RsmD